MNTPGKSRRNRALVSTLAGAVAGLLLLAGCGGDATGNEGAIKDDGSVDLSKVTLIVGDQKGGSKALLQAAGLLDDTEYDIEWKEFTSGPPLLEALNAGSIHVGGVGNTPPLFAAAAKSKFKVVQGATYGGKGDAIVVPKDSPAQSVADLKGKTIGVAEGSSANYNLLAQLQAAGLKYSDVEVKNLQPADALAAFSSGHLDAWAIWEPFTSQAEQEADARVLADGSKLANGYTFEVASDAAIDDPATEAALKDYLSRIAQAQVWSGTHKEEWSKVWAEETGLSPSITLAAVNNREVQPLPIDQTVIDSEQDMADAFSDNDLLPGEIDVSDYFTDDFNADTTGEAVKQ
ncbi:ABC transporter substrate-binding protein [Nocardioides sp. CN2-186]|uniref:ABC transporter substrate-binding protein n=1 Tax=Nocardioides tweenelious TaxID=3156607 RepID=UPI0032B5997D